MIESDNGKTINKFDGKDELREAVRFALRDFEKGVIKTFSISRTKEM